MPRCGFGDQVIRRKHITALAAMTLLVACGGPPPLLSTPSPGGSGVQVWGSPSSTPSARTLGGLTSGDLEATFEKVFDVRCGSVQGGKNSNHIYCRRPGLSLRLDLPTNSGRDILQIDAITDQGRSAAAYVFHALGALQYDGAQPDRARAWVGQHLDNTTSEHFGPAQFAVSHAGEVYSLTIQAV